MKANASACLIVRDDAGSTIFEECLESIRPHVEEIVVLDTGSKDNTLEIARKYADVVEVFTDCNDPVTGEIADFGLARQKSFSLATKPWVLWVDSDDVLAGGENIAGLIERADKARGDADWCYVLPYEYAYNEHGECTCLHYRERLLSSAAAMKWVNPVHEVLIPDGGKPLVLNVVDDVVYKHQRHRSKKAGQPGRNLRILQKLVEVTGTDDARHFYYLGLEYLSAGNLEKSTEWLSKYLEKSGWDDEKAMACLKLVEISYAKKEYQEGIRWAFRAVECRETWGEGYFALARGFYVLATAGGPNAYRNWERCAHFARVGLSLPPTRTLLFVNPLDREYVIHTYLNMALSQIGDIPAALASAEAGLRRRPEDTNLRFNKGFYEAYLARCKVVDGINALKNLGKVTNEEGDRAIAIAHNAPDWPPYKKPDGYPKNVTGDFFPRARVTPHAQAWGIPEAHEHDDLPLRTTDAQLQSIVLMVWKELVLHDEILAAHRFIADAPYRVKHAPGTIKALAMTEKMLAWMDDADKEQTYNQPADPSVETGPALPRPLDGQQLQRFVLAISPAREGERVLDFGCFDGGLTNRWALSGYKVTGIDLCKTSVALANAKAREHATGATHHVMHFEDVPKLMSELRGTFDVVTCSDTYEHVRDHVREVLAPAREMLAPGGRASVVTPHGAWMRGCHVANAHPWRWADEIGKAWISDEHRSHLIAPTVWTVAENMRRAGFWVKDSYAVLCESPDAPGQGNVFSVGLLEPPACSGERLDVVFACGDCFEDWTPRGVAGKGIGGSETAVVEVARRLAALGHRVRVFTSTGPDGEGIYDGVEYRQSAHLELAGKCDVLVAWRQASLLEATIEARARVLWVHDVWALGATHPNLLRADKILALSAWHRQNVIDHHNLHPDHVAQTRNGLDLARFDQVVARDPLKVVSSSSPDRGLQSLLKMWPRIRERVPGATLHVFYGFYNWRKFAEMSKNEDQLKTIAMLEKAIVDLEPYGVVMRGRVDQRTLAREFLSAGAWAAPTWFSETSCITAMEAQAAGLRIVTSPIAALVETVGDRGKMIDGDWLSPDYQAKFVDALAGELTRPEEGDRERLRDYARKHFSWDEVAESWVGNFHQLTKRVKENPITRYQPSRGYTR